MKQKHLGWGSLILAVLLCSGCFTALLIDMLPDLRRPTRQVTIAEIEAGLRPPASGAEFWHVSGGVYLPEHAVIVHGAVATASWRSARDVYTAYIPYASSPDVPLREVRVEGRFVLGSDPALDVSVLLPPTGGVYFATPEHPKAGPEHAGLAPGALAVYDIDAGKLPSIYLLLIPGIPLVLAVVAMVRKARRGGGSRGIGRGNGE